ncbi:uncharacterized protein LOC122253362 [Penaeus japonicus]|uniref:uncharacterized protein LOC122253362 n=1 Tax=Penaeus japonicus TaxID=27405 RepID=UPI001C70F48A|nr:uncharacterized protein LOC122253362 [Penaeus japonicus]
MRHSLSDMYRLLCPVVAALCALAVASPTVAPLAGVPAITANDNATRVAMYWRHMIGRHPQAAAQASMYWRVMSVDDPEGAADAAMEARKSTATDPEGMAQAAFYYQGMASRTGGFARLADEYWRKMAAHDPEVTARSVMYWRSDPSTAMYW